MQKLTVAHQGNSPPVTEREDTLYSSRPPLISIFKKIIQFIDPLFYVQVFQVVAASYMRATCPSHSILHDFVTLTIFGEKYTPYCLSLWYSFQPSVAFCPLDLPDSTQDYSFPILLQIADAKTKNVQPFVVNFKTTRKRRIMVRLVNENLIGFAALSRNCRGGCLNEMKKTAELPSQVCRCQGRNRRRASFEQKSVAAPIMN